MEWVQVLSIIISLLATVMWSRSEARNDIRELDARMTSTINTHKAETSKILDLIREESRDFHGRLCAIEERYRKDQHRSYRKRRRY